MRHYYTGQCRRAILIIFGAALLVLLVSTNFLSSSSSNNNNNNNAEASATTRSPMMIMMMTSADDNKTLPGRCRGSGDEMTWQSQLIQRAKNGLVAGRAMSSTRSRNGTKPLVLGIASVYREQNYLRKTLVSLIRESDEEERRDVTVIIYLADVSAEKNQKQLECLRKEFSEQLDSGFFQVIMSSPDIYPPMDFAASKRTFNDSEERVRWRTKQVIDFSFLFTYAQTQGEYYLVVEDDVVASTQYITAMREFIATRHSRRWVALQFTGFLGIGLLFRTSDLPKLIQLLWMFHQEQPVDMLMREFINLQVPEPNLIVRRIPSLFQHIGVQSSLPNKLQKLKDTTFNIADRKFKIRNPPADLVTTMKVYNDFVPEYAYRTAPGFFWGIAKNNDTLDIIFPTPISISRIVVITGIMEAKRKMKDPIKNGTLEIGDVFQRIVNNNAAVCDNFKVAQRFREGIVDYQERRTQETRQCVRIRLGPGQKSWVIIREIKIFT